MMKTLADFIPPTTNPNEPDFTEISDKIWTLGSLEEIKKQVSHEVLTLHIGINTIGNWLSGGWWSVISEMPEFIPYIPDMLEKFKLPEVKAAFETVIAVFLKDTCFAMNDDYVDTVNFLQNIRFKVHNESLNSLDIAFRKQKIAALQQALERLETLTEPVWGYGNPHGEWAKAVEFIQSVFAHSGS